MADNVILTVVGYLVKDSVVTESAGKEKFGRFRLAADIGSKTKETLFLDVKMFGRAAGDIEYYGLNKGDKVSVTGRLNQETYEKDGTEYKSLVITAFSAHKIDKPAGRQEDPADENEEKSPF